MGGVDFITPEDAPKSGSSSGASPYDIEYTNPESTTQELKPAKQNVVRHVIAAVQAPVQKPIKKPIQQPIQKTTILPPTKPIVQAVPTPVVPIPAAPQAKPIMTQPPVKVVPPVIAQPQIKPRSVPQVVAQPVAPAQSPVHAAPELSGAPRQTRSTLANGIDIVVQNVAGMKGATTDPEVMSSGGLHVNLVPSHSASQGHFDSLTNRLLRIIAWNSLAIAIVYGAMVGYQSYFLFRTQANQLKITELDQTIGTYVSLQQKINTTNATLTTIADLLTGHVYWTQWFTFLETYTLPEVLYIDFTGSKDGVMNLDAITDDFSAVSKQVNVFKSLPEVQSVEVTTATRDSEVDAASNNQVIHFTISLKVDPTLLKYGKN